MNLGDFFDDEVDGFMKFLVGAGVLIAEDNRSPLDIQCSFRQEPADSIQIVVLPLVLARFSDIDGRTWPLRFHERKPIVIVDLSLILTLYLHFIIFFFLLVRHPMLLLWLLLRHYDLLVEVFRGENVVDVVRGEVVAKELVVDGGAHQDYPHLRMLSDYSLDGQQDEVSIDVSFMDFIQDDEGVFVEEVSAVD